MKNDPLYYILVFLQKTGRESPAHFMPGMNRRAMYGEGNFCNDHDLLDQEGKTC
jgi:hypothetical protein